MNIKELEQTILFGLSIELPASPLERVHAIKDLWQNVREIVGSIETRVAVIENDLKPGGVAKYYALSDKEMPGLDSYKIDSGKYMMFEHIGLARDIGKTLASIKGEYLNEVTANKELFFYPPNYRPDDDTAVIEYLLPIY